MQQRGKLILTEFARIDVVDGIYFVGHFGAALISLRAQACATTF